MKNLLISNGIHTTTEKYSRLEIVLNCKWQHPVSEIVVSPELVFKLCQRLRLNDSRRSP